MAITTHLSLVSPDRNALLDVVASGQVHIAINQTYPLHLAAAAHRVADEELGTDVALRERLGVHAHFWAESETPEGVSRHTVNVVYRAAPATDAFEIDLDEQHSAYRFLAEPEPGLHEYVREYLDTYDLLAAS